MPKVTTDRLKYNDPIGVLPTLQYLLPEQLQIDESYQRSIENPKSASLIRKIAQYWSWDRCLPLVVSRRSDGALFVIDGQHRLAAARLRGDIIQLPAVVGNYASAADEAASFVHLNQERAPLTGLQIFHAAVASEDSEALAIIAAVAAAGLRIGLGNNLELSPPMTLINVGGIRQAWRRWGQKVTSEALQVLACAFAGERLIYAGTIFPGIVAVCAQEFLAHGALHPARFAILTNLLGKHGQQNWRKAGLDVKAAQPNLNYAAAAASAVETAWRDRIAKEPAPVASPPRPVRSAAPVSAAPAAIAARPAPVRAAVASVFGADGKAWCKQCEQRVTQTKVAGCASRFCTLKSTQTSGQQSGARKVA